MIIKSTINVQGVPKFFFFFKILPPFHCIGRRANHIHQRSLWKVTNIAWQLFGSPDLAWVRSRKFENSLKKTQFF